MKIRNYLLVFVTAFATTFFLASCLNEENKIPENCYDGVLNNGEFLVDCGGPNCAECDHCINGVWDAGETCVDCGGECGPCPQCNNCIQDGDESGIDCGGSNCGPCINLCNDGILNGNEDEVDCGGACDACPTCVDEMMNGDEIGIDCGGSDCPPCATDGNCTNGLMDGDEWWNDCGGTTCELCDTILQWKVGSVVHVVPPTAITMSYNSGTGVITVGGTSLSLGQLAFTLTPATGTWIQGTTFDVGPTTAPGNAFGYTIGGLTYSSASTNGDMSVTIQRYVPAPNFYRITFGGTLETDDGTETISITNGVFMAMIP